MALETIRDRSNRTAQAEVYRPATEADLIKLLQDFNRSQTSVTIAASRTALTGSCVPEIGVVIDIMSLAPVPVSLDLPLGKKLLSPNLIIEDLDVALDQEQRVYLPTPGYKKCSLGGNVATNASGPRTFSFGPTRDHVWFLRVVLMDGAVLEITRGERISEGDDFKITSLEGKIYTIPCPNYEWTPIKNATGLYAAKPLDLIDLFIGSEGLLGVITQIGINTHTFEPKIRTEAYFFERETDALKVVEAAREYGFDKAQKKGFISIEFMDQGALKLVGDKNYENYEAAVEIEYFASDQALIDFWQSLTTQFLMPARLVGAAVAEFRYSIPLNLSNLLREYKTVKIASDFAVPVAQFPKMWQAYKQAMERFETLSVPGTVSTAIWGHIGDCHLHCNFIPQSKAQEALGQQLYLSLAKQCVALGGVLSAEHGVGKKRFVDGCSLLELQNKAMIAEIAKVKTSLDPLFLLNAGNLISKPSGKGRKEV
jgi:D-lactate dehydrogenase (cytochrome)